MSNIIKIGVLISSMSLFVACGRTTQNIKLKTTQTTKIEQQNRIHNNTNLPLWVSNPNIQNNIGVISVIPKKNIKNKKKLYYIAKLKAQAEFQTRKGTNIDSTTHIKTNTSGTTTYHEDVKISSNHLQTNKLIVKETYEDKDYFYMWMVLER
jgi:hypothetical protein